jgi:hypothetical protein
MTPRRKRKLKLSYTTISECETVLGFTQTVVEYLKSKEINANLIIITNSEDIKSTKDLDDHDEEHWQTIVQDFKDIVVAIQAEVGNANFHFFLAAPATLTMALGVTFGNYLTAHIYNWTRGENTYTEVLKLPIHR